MNNQIKLCCRKVQKMSTVISRWLVHLISATLFLCAIVIIVEGKDEDTKEHDTDNRNENGESHIISSHKEHDGVHLASWRWEEYWNIITYSLIIVICGIIKLVFHHIPIVSKHLPESTVLILVGVIIGIIIYPPWDEKRLERTEQSHANDPFPRFTTFFFFNVLLPPIVLDSAYSLYDRDFVDNLGSVVVYAVIGTIFNVFSVGFSLYLIHYLGWMGEFRDISKDLAILELLTFSSLLAAVDPVAVLAIFQEIGVNMKLYFLVFGESLLNDGVTVVIYNTMVTLSNIAESGQTIEPMQYVFGILNFFTVFFGGLIIGMIFGLATSLIVRFTKATPEIEPMIIFSMSYLSYSFTEMVHWSGILSLIGCGIIQKRYAFFNISQKSYTTVKYAVKTMASFADTTIFVYLGIVPFSETFEWHTGFILWSCLFAITFRFVSVFGLTTILNRFRGNKISLKEQFIMGYGGIRGAVSFSLANILPSTNPFKPIFLSATIFVVFFTIFIQGGTIKYIVQQLRITRRNKIKGSRCIFDDINLRLIDNLMAGIESLLGEADDHILYLYLRRIDEKYFCKLLLNKDAKTKMELKFQKIALDDHYSSLYGPSKKPKSVESINQKWNDTKGGAYIFDKSTSSFQPALEQSMKNANLSNKSQRKILLQAFSQNPYEQYRIRMPQSLEHDNLSKEIMKQREKSRKFNFASSQLGRSVLPIAIGIALDPATDDEETPEKLHLDSM